MVFEAVFDDLLRHRVRPGGQWQWRVFILTTIASNMAWELFPTFTLLRGKHYCRLKSFERIEFTFDQMVRIGTPGAIEKKSVNKLRSSCMKNNLKWHEEYIESTITSKGKTAAKKDVSFDDVKWFLTEFQRDNSSRAVEWRKNNFQPPVIPCPEGMIYNEKYTPVLSSVTMEFDLVCNREYLKAYVRLFDVLATMMGFLVGSVLSDRHGRKKVAMIFGSASFVFAVAVAVSNSIEVFIALRVIAGFLMANTHISTDVLMGEATNHRFRSIFFILQGLYYHVIVAGYYSLGAYLFEDWRFLQLLVALPAAMSAMFGWFVEESPRWLLSKGKNHEARRIIEKAILMNSGEYHLEKVVDTEKIPDCFIDLFKFHELVREGQRQLCCQLSNCCVRSKYKVYYLFCHKTLLARMVICMIASWCVMFCHVNQHYRIRIRTLNRFSSYFLLNLMAVPFAIAWYFAYRYFDRRRPFILLAAFTTLLFCAEGLLFTLGNTSSDPNKIRLSNLLTALKNANRFVLFGSVVTLSEMTALRTIELFPTDVRNSAYGFVRAFGCVGAVVGLAMKEYVLVPKAYMPFCYAASALVIAIMIFLTPAREDGALLLDTIEQFNRWFLEDKELIHPARKPEEEETELRKRKASRKKKEEKEEKEEENDEEEEEEAVEETALV